MSYSATYRFRDGTIIRVTNGSIWRYNKHGELHHDILPAIEHPNGMKAWYKNGFLHRKDGPAWIPPLAENKLVSTLNGKPLTNNPKNTFWIDGGWKTIDHAIQKPQYYLNGVQHRPFRN